MTLSPEERDKIYEEEQARREAQDQLTQEEERAKKDAARKNVKRAGIGCLSVLAILFVVGLLSQINTPSKQATQEKRDIYFAALKQRVRAIRAIEQRGTSIWVEMPLSAFGPHLVQEANEAAVLIAQGYVAQVGEIVCVHIHAGSFTDLARACNAP